ncbi:MAG: glycosyltransferase [Planctomycetota bacterium]|jgi:glycosyltransferase involved in cell wall biosynthesis
MRILVVSPFEPHPAADHGGAVYLGAFLAELSRQADVRVVAFAQEPKAPALGGVTSHTVPFRRNDQLGPGALGLRRLRLLWLWGLSRLPLLVAKHRSRAFRELLHRVTLEFRPQLCLVEFAVMAQYLEDLPEQRCVLTDHEHGLAVPPSIGPGSFGRRRDEALWRDYVRRYYRQAEVVQALTQPDADRLAALLERPVGVRPPLVPVPENPVTPASAERRLLFLGDYRHHPNPEAAAFLAHHVMPRVLDKVPDAELWLAGPRAGDEVRALGQHPGVRIVGYVENLQATLAKARCLLAPVFSGSGVRIKVLTALAHGLPVVANELGLQGVTAPHLALGRGEGADELAAACVRFLDSPEAAASAGAAGREWALANLGAARLVEQQLALFQALLS